MKKILFSICFIATFSSYSQDLNLGLVGYYPFNGNANDQSSSAINGTVNGPILTVGMGNQIDGAYYFDGINDYIDLTNSNRGITNKVTISYWVKTSSNGDMYPVCKYNYTQDAGYFSVINNNYAGTAGRDESGSFKFSDYGTTNVADGNWHHIISVVDVNSWEIYVDCNLESNYSSSTTSPSISNTDPMLLGKWYQENSHFFLGTIDEVRIYNRILTAQEKSMLCDEAQFSEIKENGQLTFSVYPNPSSSLININADQTCQIKITNLAGQIVFESKIKANSTLEIDVSLWNKGTYIVFLISKEAIETEKIVVI